MRLAQIVVTRFSLRRFRAAPSGRRRSIATLAPDPLAPKRLAVRLTLFELFCLPSIARQTVQDFCWIVLVDPALPARYRARLRELCAAHPRTRIVDADDAIDLDGARWLAGELDGETTHVASTNMDDDDLLAVEYLARIRAHLTALDEAGGLPSCQVIGSASNPQWDLLPTRGAPLGHVKPWSRRPFVSNAGLTLFAEYPAYDLSVLGLEHRRVARYFDARQPPEDAAVDRLRAGARAAGDDWAQWTPESRVHALTGAAPLVVVTNHVGNIQAARLFERPETRAAVRGPEDFPGMAIDCERVRQAMPAFRCTPADLPAIMARAVRAIWAEPRVPLRIRLRRTRHVLGIPALFARAAAGQRQPR